MNKRIEQETIQRWEINPISVVALAWDKELKGILFQITWTSTIASSFLELIELHYKQHHSPSFYAKKLNITTRYLGKICHQYLRHAPKDCIHLRLMKEACSLLKNPDLEIKEVCWSLGFSYPSYFTRFFKNIGGVPPDCYRRFFQGISHT